MTAPRWSLVRPDDLLYRDWDDLGAVYDAASGNTHLLNTFAIELLDLLVGGPRSQAALLTEVQELLPDTLSAEEANAALSIQLQTLQQLDLVQTLPA
jgi:PqqD family protein of HPr-rel-A system